MKYFEFLIFIFIFSNLFAAEEQLPNVQITPENYPQLTNFLQTYFGPGEIEYFNSSDIIGQTNELNVIQNLIESYIDRTSKTYEFEDIDNYRNIEQEIKYLIKELLEIEGSNAEQIREIKKNFKLNFNYLQRASGNCIIS